MTTHLAERIAQTLNWTVEDVRQFSLPTLRELVRVPSPKLAREITLVMNSPEYWFEEPPKKRRFR